MIRAKAAPIRVPEYLGCLLAGHHPNLWRSAHGGGLECADCGVCLEPAFTGVRLLEWGLRLTVVMGGGWLLMFGLARLLR